MDGRAEMTAYAGTRPHSGNPTVLVVDDKPLSLLATAGVLHHESMRCVCARSVNAARKALQIGSEGVMTSPRVDRSHGKTKERESAVLPTSRPMSDAAIELIVWEVDEDPIMVLDFLAEVRSTPLNQDLPAILIADAQWAGLEKRAEALPVPTHCLFKPIGTPSLIAIAQQLLWMPSLQSHHRRRGTRPKQMGWVTLSD